MKTEQFNPIFSAFLHSFRLPIVYNKVNLPTACWLVDLDNKVTQHGITIMRPYSLIVNRQQLIGITLLEEKDNIFVIEIQFFTEHGVVLCSPLELGQLYSQVVKKLLLPQVLPFCHLLIGCFQYRQVECNLKFPSIDTVENPAII